MNELPPVLQVLPTELRSVRHQSRRRKLRPRAAGEFGLHWQSGRALATALTLTCPAPALREKTLASAVALSMGF